MFTRLYLSLALLLPVHAWSQVPFAAGGGDQMLTPPPVSGEAYPTTVGADTRSNYLRGGLSIATGYSDNVLGDLYRPVSDFDYSIYPTIEIDKATSRLHFSVIYSPGFTAYQHTTSRDQVDQNLALDFHYRLSPHATLSLRDSLQDISNAISQPDPLLAEEITGSPQVPLYAVIAPVAGQLANRGIAELTYQFSRNGMIGASGIFTNLHYFNPTEVLGIYDSSSSGGSAFYTRRLSKRHYIGATYEYSKILAYPLNAESEVQTHTTLLFCTIYLNPTFSLSFSGGPQRFDVVQLPLPPYSSWSPALTASIGWQGRHANVATSYSRIVGAGAGLVGVFQSNIARVYTRWQPARTWSVGSSGSYANNKDLTPSSFLSSQGGHTILGTVSAQRQLNEHFNVEFGYTRLHQTYSGIPVISNAPNTNREFISISYHFARPLGG
jgi:hypothetical protein